MGNRSDVISIAHHICVSKQFIKLCSVNKQRNVSSLNVFILTVKRNQHIERCCSISASNALS